MQQPARRPTRGTSRWAAPARRTGANTKDENQLGVSAGMIWGLKKAQFTIDGAARDFATVIVSTHASAP